MWRRCGLVGLTVVVLTGVSVMLSSSHLAALEKSGVAEWPQWRGPNRDGISAEKGLLSKWTEKGPAMAWEAKGLGSGYSSVAIHQGHIVTLGQKGGKLYLTALAVNDGKELWATKLLDKSDKQPNCTPTIVDGMVYAVGTAGDLFCVELESGKISWHKSFPKDFGGKMMSGWGYSESPLVDGDKLICSPGAKDAGIAALNKKTGETIWQAAIPEIGNRGGDGAAYSSIVVSNGAGVKQYVQLMGRGIVSVAADDGRFLWGYNKVANGTANIPTPIVHEDYVFCSSGYGTGSALLKLTKDGDKGVAVKEEYFLEAKTMQNHHGGMVMVGDYIYCGNQHNQGFPICLEWRTGKVKWSPGRGPGERSAAIVYADGQIYFRYENGKVALIAASPDGYQVNGVFEPPHGGAPCWAHPVVTGGRLYLREQDALYVYNVSASEVASR